MALTGAVVNHSGSCAADAWATIFTFGLSPSSSAFAADIINTAAAPSLILEALAAVTVPSFSKEGRSVFILSKSALAGSSSSAITTGSPLRRGTSTAVISLLNNFSFCAFSARLYDCSANASCSSRE